MPEIIKQVFRDLGFSDFEDALTRPYREWEYCVQYRETSFDFISRLMEQEGIYYWFRHEQKRHILVLSDAYGAHRSPGGYASVPYYPPTLGHRERDHFFDWQMAREVQPGSLTLNDYDFQRPGARLEVRSNIARPHAAADYPLYDYPGEYVQSQDGEQYARNRIEAIQAQHERVRLRGVVRGIGAGHLFRLSGYPRDDQNREYLVVGAEYRWSRNSTKPAAAAPARSSRASWTASTPASRSASRRRPRCRWCAVRRPRWWWGPRARRSGPTNTAGSSAFPLGSPRPVEREQLLLDSRVPGLGREELGFDADPADRPGSDRQLPRRRPGPADHHRAGLQRRADGALRAAGERHPERDEEPFEQGGTPANFNEIRMEDKKGAEQLYIHAERNQDNLVENDASLSVGHDRNKSIGHDELARIGNNRTRAVKLNDTLLVGGAKSDSVTGTYLIGGRRADPPGLRQERGGVQRRRHHQYLRQRLQPLRQRKRQHRHRRPPRPQFRRRQRGRRQGQGVQGTIDGQVQAMFRRRRRAETAASWLPALGQDAAGVLTIRACPRQAEAAVAQDRWCCAQGRSTFRPRPVRIPT